MNEIIRHEGVVESLEEGCLHVRILQASACSECKVSTYCHIADGKEKTIDVVTSDASNYVVGDQVEVTASRSVGMKAVAWAFGMPFLVMVGTVFAVSLLTHNEGLAALMGILSLIPCYGGLYLMRDKFKRSLTFSVTKMNNKSE